jgi:hypothetical protein
MITLPREDLEKTPERTSVPESPAEVTARIQIMVGRVVAQCGDFRIVERGLRNRYRQGV